MNPLISKRIREDESVLSAGICACLCAFVFGAMPALYLVGFGG